MPSIQEDTLCTRCFHFCEKKDLEVSQMRNFLTSFSSAENSWNVSFVSTFSNETPYVKLGHHPGIANYVWLIPLLPFCFSGLVLTRLKGPYGILSDVCLEKSSQREGHGHPRNLSPQAMPCVAWANDEASACLMNSAHSRNTCTW